MRKRNNTIHIQMNDNELNRMRDRIQQSNKHTIQAYALDALLNGEITDQQLIDELQNTNKLITNINNIENGIGNNINQIAKKVNTYDVVLSNDIEDIKLEIDKSREERNNLWQLIRSLQQKLQHIQQ